MLTTFSLVGLSGHGRGLSGRSGDSGGWYDRRGQTGVSMRLGVTLKMCDGGRGVRNRFWRGDGGAEGGTVGIQVEDVINGVVKSIVSGGNVV